MYVYPSIYLFIQINSSIYKKNADFPWQGAYFIPPSEIRKIASGKLPDRVRNQKKLFKPHDKLMSMLKMK